MKQLALSGAALLLLAACGPSTPKEMPPEEVVLQWQRFIDYNQFEQARELSIRQAREYVDDLDAMTGDDTVGIRETELFDLRCEVQGDSAVCRYFTEDEIGEKVLGQLSLRKAKGQWRIDQVEGFDPSPIDTLRPGEEELVFPPSDSLEGE